MNKKIRENLKSYSLLLPNLILFVLFSIYPVLWTLKFVFYQYGGYSVSTPKFVGLDNIFRVFRDTVYWQSVVNTFVYAGGKILITIPLAFLLAFLRPQGHALHSQGVVHVVGQGFDLQG